MFLQVPLPHGCFSHSSTSGRRAASTRLSLANVETATQKGSGVFTDTHGLLPRGLEAVGAEAAIAAQRVDALTRIADARVLTALVTV